MALYKLSESALMQFNDNRLMVINQDTGFSALGNKHAYEALRRLEEPKSLATLSGELLDVYPDSQSFIEQKVPLLIEWALERRIIEEVDAQSN